MAVPPRKRPDTDALLRRWESDKKSRIFLQLAEEYRKQDFVDAALSVLHEGLKHHPNFAPAHVSLARCLMAKRQWAEAQGELEKVHAKSPDNLLAGKLLVEVLEERGEKKRALSVAKALVPFAAFDDPEVEATAKRLEEQLAGPSVKPRGDGMDTMDFAAGDDTSDLRSGDADDTANLPAGSVSAGGPEPSADDTANLPAGSVSAGGPELSADDTANLPAGSVSAGGPEPSADDTANLPAGSVSAGGPEPSADDTANLPAGAASAIRAGRDADDTADFDAVGAAPIVIDMEEDDGQPFDRPELEELGRSDAGAAPVAAEEDPFGAGEPLEAEAAAAPVASESDPFGAPMDAPGPPDDLLGQPSAAAASEDEDLAASVTLAELYEAQDSHDEAAAIYEKLLEKRPADEKVRAALERCRGRLGGEDEEAEGPPLPSLLGEAPEPPPKVQAPVPVAAAAPAEEEGPNPDQLKAMLAEYERFLGAVRAVRQ